MMTDLIDKEKEAKKYTSSEFLMMPCTAIGQTTSSSIAEKSNIWAEQRLSEKKCELDKKLYKSMIKLNVDMLGLADELSKMRKSASNSSLESFSVKHKLNNNKCSASGQNSPKIPPRNRPLTTGLGSNKSVNKALENRRGSACDILSPNRSNNKGKPVEFSLGEESSSEESDQSDGNAMEKSGKRMLSKQSKSSSHPNSGHHGNDLHRTISVTTCSMGHECGAHRANFQSFQNATRRYNKQLSDHSKSAVVHK